MEEALANILAMLVTDERFQLDRSPENNWASNSELRRPQGYFDTLI